MKNNQEVSNDTQEQVQEERFFFQLGKALGIDIQSLFDRQSKAVEASTFQDEQDEVERQKQFALLMKETLSVDELVFVVGLSQYVIQHQAQELEMAQFILSMNAQTRNNG